MTRERILVIDDEVDTCDLLKGTLEQKGDFEVKTVNSGEEGLAASRSFQPALILLDVRMPGLSGLEVLARLKSDPQTMLIPVIVLSALTDPETIGEAVRLYTEEYLTKPVQLVHLRATIQRVLKRARVE
ncbi:MAG: response regulator [Candidatus Riflebacteria bacterium]|nr:response regulator [Candidatus Riflebacteria bacterium]